MDTWFDIAITALTSSNLIALIVFFIKRHDAKKGWMEGFDHKLDDIRKEAEKKDKELEKKLNKLEKDSVRTQLLILMNDYQPEDEHELLQVAEHYFVVLKANWYMTPKFNRFLKKNKIAQPEWLEK